MIAPIVLSLLLSTASAAPAWGDGPSYTPSSANCPSEPLVRAASGLSDNEEAYRVARKAVADEALTTWLTKTNSGFGIAELPTVRTSR